MIAEYGRSAEPAMAVGLSDAYAGRFALDFAYDEWCCGLSRVASRRLPASRRDADPIWTSTGATTDRGISLARRALEVEPRNEDLELSLLKLLRGAGAHSAAAEQYSRYANVLRNDLGVEPPARDAV